MRIHLGAALTLTLLTARLAGAEPLPVRTVEFS